MSNGDINSGSANNTNAQTPTDDNEIDTVDTTDEILTVDQTGSIDEGWIKIINGKFTCSECENESIPETNTEDGIVSVNLDLVKKDLIEYPKKVIYGVCPICGMEYEFKLVLDALYLAPSEMEK